MEIGSDIRLKNIPVTILEDMKMFTKQPTFSRAAEMAMINYTLTMQQNELLKEDNQRLRDKVKYLEDKIMEFTHKST